MNVFWSFWLWGNNNLDEVNEFLDERRLNEELNLLTLDSASLIRAFKEKVSCVMFIWSCARRLAFLWNSKRKAFCFKEPKKESSKHKIYMFF